MGRSNYSEDYDESIWLYRANVDRAISGARGQKFLRDLVDALGALPDKRLIAEELQHDGAVCAIGSVGLRRGVDMTKLDPSDATTIGKIFGIAECMAREVVFENDEGAGYYASETETPEQRWQRIRAWASGHLK